MDDDRMIPHDPRAEYLRALDVRRAQVERLGRRDNRCVGLRLALAGLTAATAIAAWGSPSIPWSAALVPVAAFVAVAIVHDRTLRELAASRRATAWIEAGIARIDGRWEGAGSHGERFSDPRHLYASDLDLFGRGSLFEWLSRARTAAGEEALASWLLDPATPRALLERHEAVRELAARPEFREGLATAGERIAPSLHLDRVRAWAESPSELPRRRRGVLVAITIAGVVALLGWVAGGWGPLPALAIGTAQAAIVLRSRAAVRRILSEAGGRSAELRLLAELLSRFEGESFRSPLLARLREEMDVLGAPPSRSVRRLARLVEMLDARRNQLFLPIAAALAWGTHGAYALERWRALHGSAVVRWIATVGELEALASLATAAWEHPDDPFPSIVEDGAVLEAEGLGHPLLRRDTCVRNDVALGSSARLLVVSGSNMSGKSTLLRAVGVNAVLALAGGTVRARAMRVGPLALGATLRIQDSLHEGASRFWAEITKLRRIVDRTSGPRPVLVLLDELLHGTNSHDRAAGSEAVLRGLIDRGAIGLVTTHDLALAELADRMAPFVVNAHFEDRLENGVLHFDYVMRPGVVRRSNALELMRSVGLIPEPPAPAPKQGA